MHHLFIISGPRSGTTWLVRALNAHPGLRITLDKYVDALLQPHSWKRWTIAPRRPRSAGRRSLLNDRTRCAADAGAFDRVAGSTLIEQGYEPDASWTMRQPKELSLAA